MPTENQTSAIGKHLELHLQLQTSSTEDSPKVKSKTCPKQLETIHITAPHSHCLFTDADASPARSKNTLVPWSSEFHSEPRGESKTPTYSLETSCTELPKLQDWFSKHQFTSRFKTSHSDLWILHCIRDEAIWQHSVAPAIDHDVSLIHRIDAIQEEDSPSL